MKSTTFLVCTILIASVLAGCPTSDLDSAASFSSQFPNPSNQAVIITQDTVLDASPGVVLKSITVRAKLYFKDVDLELRTGFLKVENGGFLIGGGSDCPISSKVKIILHGLSSAAKDDMGADFDGTAFGSKGLVVANGGSLSLWGRMEGPTWTRISNTATKGSRSIVLKDAVQWAVGDSIVITSTDFSGVLDFNKFSAASYPEARGFPFPDQNERRIISSISGDKKTVSFDTPLTFTHYGAGNQFAEVGLLNRRIVITSSEDSEADNAYGGHILMRKGKVLELSGIEVTKMGQRGILARYPVHFHNMSEASDIKPFIQDSSIHTNFQRCLVVHQSHGVLIKNNVAFNTSGHCYFLEDGMEHGNVFDGNLGVLANPISLADKGLLPSDNRAAIFWIVNPNNTWINNVAAGGHHGFWFAMPERPRNLALQIYTANDKFAWPRKHPLGKFDLNVAHSNRENGLHIDDMENADGTTSLADYTPMVGPYMSGYPYGSGALEAHFTNFLAYKNRDSGIWGKTSLRFSGCIMEDNARGFMVNGKTVLSDSLFVGETDNIGNPVLIYGKNYSRSLASKWGDANGLLEGHSSYDNGGPQFSVHNRFVNYVSTSTRKAGALVPLRSGPFMLFPGTQFGHQLSFENANEFYLNYASNDCEYGWNVLDADGKISGYPGGAWIQSNETHFLREGCVWKSQWNAYVCPTFGEGYAQVTVRGTSAAVPNPAPGYDIPKDGVRVIRGVFRPLGSSLDGPKGLMEGADTGGTYQLMHNLITRRGYALEFYTPEGTPGTTPNPLRINVQSSNPGDWMIIAIPYPQGTTFSEVVDEYYPQTKRTQVNSIEELTHLTWFFDTATNHLYLLTFNDYDGAKPSDAFGFKVSDGGNYRGTRISASCGSSCSPPLNGIPPVVTTPKPFRGEPYIAILNGKQSLTNPSSSNYGRAFFYFHPNAVNGKRELHYKIFHDVPGTSNTISIKEGAPGSEGFTLSLNIPIGNTAAAGILSLTRREWEVLATGGLYVSVSTGGNEIIRGRILCDGTCSKPPKSALKVGDVCDPSYDIQSIYSDGAFTKPIVSGSWNTSRTTSNYANTDALCGTSSWALSFSETSASGASWWSTGSTGLIIDPKFKSIEFFVKTPAGKRGSNLGLNIYKEGANPSSTSIDILPSEIDNFVIDDLTWSRVRVSLTRLVIAGKPRTIYIYNHWTAPTASLLIDEFRFSTEEATPITEIADIKIPQAADFYKEDIEFPTENIPVSDGTDTTPRVEASNVVQMASANSISSSILVFLFATIVALYC